MRYRAQVPTHSFAFVGAEKATAGPGVTDAIASADVVLLAPSNPVVSVGAILAVPGIRGALRSTSARVIGYSPIIGGKPLRGMADECLSVIGVASTSEAVGGYYGAALGAGILDGWLVHEGDHAEIAGVEVRSVPAADDRPGGDRRDGARRTRSGGGHAVTEHGSAAADRDSCPSPGCPSSAPATTWPPRSPPPRRGCATTTSWSSPARCCPSARAASWPRPPIPRSGMRCGAS